MNTLAALLMVTFTGAGVTDPASVPEQPVAPVWRAPNESDSFAQQWAYVISDARFNAVCCSRQAGKTYGAGLAAELVLSRPHTKVIYATLIRRNAKKLFWRPLLDGLEKRGCGSVRVGANETEMMLWLANGSFCQALSCEKMADLARIRGDQADLFLVDECQEPRDDVLEALTTRIIPPMLMKRGGRLDLLGTVPEAEPSAFSERLDGAPKFPEWKAYGWDCFANPHMDRALIERTCREAGLVPGHPVYEREILGRRVKDPSKLAYEFEPGRNEYDDLDGFFTGPSWRHAMGIDLGFQDRDAIVVVAWRADDALHRLYVRHFWQQNHLDVDQLSPIVADCLKRFRPMSSVVGDHGGHGAVKVMATLEHRLNVLIAKKPGDVMVSVGLVNDDLRTGRLLLPRGSELGQDLGRVQRSVNLTTKRVEINKVGYHSDLSEALRYAHAGARHFAAKAPKPEPTLDERRMQRFATKRAVNGDPWNPRNYRRAG